jgi:hypothetical protein
MNPILVTGSHRSGTTWVGRMLALHPSLRYLHEPLNPVAGVCLRQGRCTVCGLSINRWFTGVDQQNELEFFLHFKHLFSDIAHENRLPLVKDPIAVFSAEWLASRFNMTAIVMIRHPAGFASSLKRLNYHFGFSQLWEQPALAARWPDTLKGQLREAAQRQPENIIDQATLLWRLIYWAVDDYRKRRPKWLFVRHEDLAQNPIVRFRDIFGRLGLEFSPGIEQAIALSADTKNPVHASNPHDVNRNSATVVHAWKTILSPQEIGRIKEETADIWPRFYEEAEW